MIQANELRIGNWASYNNEYVQISMISTATAYFGMKYQSLKYIEPILLTREVIKQCGFGITGSGNYNLMDEDVWLAEKTLGGWSYSIMVSANAPEWIEIAEINYLHELQNLFYSLNKREISYFS